jgi:putative endonuclease
MPLHPPAKTQKQQDGDAAEARAERYLATQGFKLIQRNHRCRHGEIDLIMQDGDTTVFVEVRLRREGRVSGNFGGAAESINATKQAKIIAAARHWLLGKPECYCRFDVVLLDHSGEIEWIRAAFCE